AKVAGNYSNTSDHGSGNTMIQGVLNIPLITDRLAVRAVGYRFDEGGFYRNIAGEDPATIARATALGLPGYVDGFVEKDVGQVRTTGGRLAALWRASDALDITLNLLTQKIEQDGDPIGTIGKYEQAEFPVAPQGRVRGEEGAIADTDIDLANLVLNY